MFSKIYKPSKMKSIVNINRKNKMLVHQCRKYHHFIKNNRNNNRLNNNNNNINHNRINIFTRYRKYVNIRKSQSCIRVNRMCQRRTFISAAEEETASMENAMERLMRLQSQKNSRIYGGAFLLIGMGTWIYGSTIIDYFSGNVAEVTSKSIASEEVQSEVQQLAIGAVNTVLQDEKVLKQTVTFLQNLVQQPETQMALVQLLVIALRNPETQNEVNKLSQNVVQYILKDQQTLDQVTILFGNVLQEPWTKKVVLDLLSQLMEDEQTRAALGQLLVHTLARADVVQSSTDAATSVTHNVLNDEEVGKHAAFWMQQVLGDSNIQKKSGEHLWNAFTYAINPFGGSSSSSTNTTKNTTISKQASTSGNSKKNTVKNGGEEKKKPE